MQYDEFMGRLQSLASLDEPAAERAARATLSTLGECLYRTEQDDLGSQLPKALNTWLGKRSEPENLRQSVERLELEEFYNRVKARAEVGYQQAVVQARAVMAVLREAVGEGAWDKLRAEFPAEYADLLNPTELDRQTIRMAPRPGARRRRT